MHLRPQSWSVVDQRGSLGSLTSSFSYTLLLGLLPPFPGEESNTSTTSQKVPSGPRQEQNS